MPVLAGGTGSSPIGDRPTLEWVGPDGTAFHLGNWSANKFFAADGVSGLGAAPRTIVADDSPQGGTTIRHIQHGPRRVPLPICWEGDDHAECLHWERRLGESLTSTRRLGAGQLRVMRPDGSVRQIAAVYEGGWDPEGTPTQRWAVPVLYCPDPLWSDPAETQLVSAYGDTGGDFLDPFPTISSSTALGQATATNPGGEEAWPQWVITGPASLVTIANLTTGESFVVDPNAAGIGWGDLLAGQTVTIRTRPAEVIGPDGSVWSAAVDWATSRLWALPPGESTVEVSAVGAADGTQVVGTFHARWELP